MFTARRDVLEHPSWRLFIRSAKLLDNRRVYDYFGKYTTSLVGYLTRHEFGNLSQKVCQPTDNNTWNGAVLDVFLGAGKLGQHRTHKNIPGVQGHACPHILAQAWEAAYRVGRDRKNDQKSSRR
jgi:hypothetical protein